MAGRGAGGRGAPPKGHGIKGWLLTARIVVVTTRLALPLFEVALRLGRRRARSQDSAAFAARLCGTALSLRADWSSPIGSRHVNDTIVTIAITIIRWAIDALSVRDGITDHAKGHAGSMEVAMSRAADIGWARALKD
eukprot:7377683-Prymnesium_polylepis.2